MVVLTGRRAAAAALLAAAGGCYAPELADCTTACSSSADCGPGQACGPSGLCAAPDTRCTDPGIGGPVDARVADGAMVDAAPATVPLRVRIQERGFVVVTGIGTCDSDGQQHGDCTFDVPARQPLALRAIPHLGFAFDKWISGPCMGQPAMCSIELMMPAEVRARFRD